MTAGENAQHNIAGVIPLANVQIRPHALFSTFDLPLNARIVSHLESVKSVPTSRPLSASPQDRVGVRLWPQSLVEWQVTTSAPVVGATHEILAEFLSRRHERDRE